MTAMKPTRHTDPEACALVRDKPCIVCGGWPTDCAHIRSRGAGGPDTPWNLLPLCRRHHTEQHARGFVWMSKRYPPVTFELYRRGWRLVTGFKGPQWIHQEE
jgi:HNH endonuclease